MSRRRRRPAKEAKNGNNSGGGGGGSSSSSSKEQATAALFWRNTEPHATETVAITPTRDPAAVPRSLGDPPLSPDTAAQHHLAVVYEEAVRTATALAAVNGLLADLPNPDEDLELEL
jgi:hypothetical protein